MTVNGFDAAAWELWPYLASGACVHLETLYGENTHHIVESGFKALARALRTAVEIDPKTAGRAPSTKGVL